jgi:hypothetical protein
MAPINPDGFTIADICTPHISYPNVQEADEDQNTNHGGTSDTITINFDGLTVADTWTQHISYPNVQEPEDDQNTDPGGKKDTIMQWNINGLRNNFEELKLLAEEIEPAVICLQETHEKQGQSPVFGGYKVYSKAADAERAKHGVAVMVREGIKSERIELKTRLNAVAITAELKRTVNICSIYLPPYEKITSGQLARLLTQLPKPYIITGDINAHNRRWGSRSTNNRGDMIAKIADKHGLNILNNGDPTHISFASRTETAIDVTLITPDIHPEIEWYVHGETFGSDHYPTICRFTEPNPKATKRPGWRTKTANWEGYQETLTEILRKIGEKPTIEEITSAIHESATKNVKRTSQEITQRRLKWMTTEIR